MPVLLQYYCTTIAQCTTLPRPRFCMPLQHTTLAMTMSCKGQAPVQSVAQSSVETDRPLGMRLTLVSLKLKKTVDAEGGRTFAVRIEGG